MANNNKFNNSFSYESCDVKITTQTGCVCVLCAVCAIRNWYCSGITWRKDWTFTIARMCTNRIENKLNSEEGLKHQIIHCVAWMRGIIDVRMCGNISVKKKKSFKIPLSECCVARSRRGKRRAEVEILSGESL